MDERVSLNERLSRNFTMREHVRSETASRLGIDNSMRRNTPEHVASVALYTKVIQPVREYVGPLFVTSGYRCPELNAAVGGVPDSQHQKGEAADLASGRMSPYELACHFLDDGVPFDQLILEHDQGVVHVSHSPDHNRGEVMTRYVNADGDLMYVTGLVEEADV